MRPFALSVRSYVLGKIRKKYHKFASSAEFARSMVSVKMIHHLVSAVFSIHFFLAHFNEHYLTLTTV